MNILLNQIAYVSCEKLTDSATNEYIGKTNIIK